MITSSWKLYSSCYFSQLYIYIYFCFKAFSMILLTVPSLSPSLIRRFLVANSRQLFVEIDDLQLLVLVHPSYVHVHIRRELGFLRAVRTLIARFLAALKLAVRLHVGQSSVAAIASRTMKLLSCDWALHGYVIRPARPGNRRYVGFLTTSRVDVEIRILLRLFHRVPSLISVRGHAASGHYLGTCVRRMTNLPVKRI